MLKLKSLLSQHFVGVASYNINDVCNYIPQTSMVILYGKNNKMLIEDVAVEYIGQTFVN